MINNRRLLQTFLEYVQIDSESTHEGAFAARVAADLEAIGCQVYVDDTRPLTGSDTGNLYCTLPGNTDGEPILFSAHMDTVSPGVGIEPVIEDGVIRSKGHTVLGGDDKSGVAAVVEALRTVVENDLPHPTVQAVFTVCEEIGLKGSHALEYDRIAANRAVVLDSGGTPGRMVAAAPGQYKLHATVVGRSAHAGVAPERGISAIQVLAEAITHMNLLRIDGETTANVGAIHADYATNIVAERAEIRAEVRSRSEAKLEEQKEHMVGCLQDACAKYGAALELDVSKAYCGYSVTEEDPFVQEIVAACRRVGLTPVLEASGGGSDANNFSGRGIMALNLGTGMNRVHTTDEEIAVAHLEQTAALVLSIITG